jgi:hypothetical protein
MDRTIVLPYEPTNPPFLRELDRILAARLSSVTLVYTYLYPAGYYWLGEIYLICTITRTLRAHVTLTFHSFNGAHISTLEVNRYNHNYSAPPIGKCCSSVRARASGNEHVYRSWLRQATPALCMHII